VWDNFTDFIRNNNNVTWRNFNVENNLPPPGAPPPGFIELPFLLTSAHDKARIFDIHIVSKLPKGAKFFLDAPLHIAQKLFNNEVFWTHDQRGERVRIPLKNRGFERLRKLELPAKLRAKCKLLVLMPKENLDRFYEVSVRQYYKDLEVGRISWNIGPVKVKKPYYSEQAIRQAEVITH
jgi:hypothetical protein